jgi:curli production assembly/transport component CsgF
MKSIYKIFLILALVIVASGFTYSQQLVYTPINPSLGGSSFNGQWMLSYAQAQDRLQDTRDVGLISDPFTDFQESLKRAIISQLTRNLVADSFGENQLREGRYELGDYVVDISQGGNGLNIIIIDNLTGNQTNILIPYY